MVTTDLSVIPNEKVRQAVLDVFAEKLNSTDFTIKIENGASSGDNFIGIVYRVVATRNKSDKNDNGVNEKSCFLKVAPLSEARRERFFSRLSFLREILVYNEILSQFRQLQESHGIIPEENGFHEYAKCYMTIDEAPIETLIFEDLKNSGFEMLNHRDTEITFDHAKLWITALGKYHALSFALRDQQPEKFAELTSGIPEVFLRENDAQFNEYFNGLKDILYEMLKGDDDAELLKTMKNVVGDSMFEMARKLVNGKSAEPYAVICHGDCWNNNTLFKFDSNKKPVDIRFVDFQITRYASPITDIVYYLFSCTTKEFRDAHLDSLLKAYHSSLSDMLRRIGSDPEKLFPFSALEDQLRRFGIFSLPMACMLLPMLTIKERVPLDLDEVATSDMTVSDFCSPLQNPIFLERMRGVLDDLQQLGFIEHRLK